MVAQHCHRKAFDIKLKPFAAANDPEVIKMHQPQEPPVPAGRPPGLARALDMPEWAVLDSTVEGTEEGNCSDGCAQGSTP